MVDASIRELQIPAEAKKRDEVKVGIGMNNDHGAMGRAGGIMLWHWQVSQQTFWTFLDSASEILVETSWERYKQRGRVCVCKGRWDVGGRGLVQSDECPWNSPGMSDFLGGGLLNEGRCGPRGNHRIIIPPMLNLFPVSTPPKHICAKF